MPAVLSLLPQQHQQQPSSYANQECTRPPWPNEIPSLMHAGRRMRFPPPSTRQMEYNADEAAEAGELNNWLFGLLACWLVGLLACWLVGLSTRRLIGSSAHRLVGLLAKQSTLLNECWEEDDDPSPQHWTSRVRCQ